MEGGRRPRRRALVGGNFQLEGPAETSDLVLDGFQTDHAGQSDFDGVVRRTERLLDDLGLDFFVTNARRVRLVDACLANLLMGKARKYNLFLVEMKVMKAIEGHRCA